MTGNLTSIAVTACSPCRDGRFLVVGHVNGNPRKPISLHAGQSIRVGSRIQAREERGQLVLA